jgi:hypothetical protein
LFLTAYLIATLRVVWLISILEEWKVASGAYSD